jgi:hypothetical protein
VDVQRAMLALQLERPQLMMEVARNERRSLSKQVELMLEKCLNIEDQRGVGARAKWISVLFGKREKSKTAKRRRRKPNKS